MQIFGLSRTRVLTVVAALLLGACGTTTEPVEPTEPQPTLSDSGKIVEAGKNGEDMSWMEERLRAAKHWKEQRDTGDDPLTPGCACHYELPNCGGAITGRAVDECFPRNGKEILQEKTVPTKCGVYGNKEYDCEKLLGKGAKCKLIDLTCCDVKTTSGYCHIDITP